MFIFRFYGHRLSSFAIAAIGAISLLNCTYADDKDSKVKTLLKEQLAVLNQVVARISSRYSEGTVPLLKLIEAKQAACKAELDLCETDAERIAVLENRLA